MSVTEETEKLNVASATRCNEKLYEKSVAKHVEQLMGSSDFDLRLSL